MLARSDRHSTLRNCKTANETNIATPSASSILLIRANFIARTPFAMIAIFMHYR